MENVKERYSWLNQSRRRNPIRLSVSIDSIQCDDDGPNGDGNGLDESSFARVANHHHNQDYEEEELEEEDDASVNNILDAVSLSSVKPWVEDSASASAISASISPPSTSSIKKKVKPVPNPKPKKKKQCEQIPYTAQHNTQEDSFNWNDRIYDSRVDCRLDHPRPPFQISAPLPQDSSDQEHVYCQLDPYFTQLKTTTLNSTFSSTATRSFKTLKFKESQMELRNAVAQRYSEMIKIHLEPPKWYKDLVGTSNLNEIAPPVYEIHTQTPTSAYGTKLGEQFRKIGHHEMMVEMISRHAKTSTLKGKAQSGKTTAIFSLIQHWTKTLESNELEMILYVPCAQLTKSLSKYIRNVFPKIKNIVKYLSSLHHLLVILDDVDRIQNAAVKREVDDILSAQVFPNCKILATTSAVQIPGLNYKVDGLSWAQTQTFVHKFFKTKSKLSEILESNDLIASKCGNPFLCVLICSLYAEFGRVPQTEFEYFDNVSRRLMLPTGDKVNYTEMMAKFGKLALSSSSERVYFSDSEIEPICGGVNSRTTGLFMKAQNFYKKSQVIYRIVHPEFSKFTTAVYLSTLTPQQFQTELRNLGGIEELLLDNSTCSALQILKLTMEMLQESSSNYLSCLTLVDVSIPALLSLLNSAGHYDSNLKCVCNVLASCKHLQISATTPNVYEWVEILASKHCPVETIEITIKPGYNIGKLVEGLCTNQSVSCVKLKSIPGLDWNYVEINLLASLILELLSEKHVRVFELSMTCLEDAEHALFQPIVDVISLTSHAVQTLVLDMDLTSDQVQQICHSLQHAQSRSLSLPNLGCGPEGFYAIGEVVKSGRLEVLNLAGCWRSSTSEGGLKLSAPMAATMSPSITSLQRTLKSPTMQRRMAAMATTTYSNSCSAPAHKSSGFHSIFSAIKLQDCELKELNLSKCVLNCEDMICLSEAVRKTKCLKKLAMEGMKTFDALSVLIAMSENESIAELNLASPHVVVSDQEIELVLKNLKRNRALRSLAIKGWLVVVESEQSLDTIQTFFNSSQLQELNLANVKVKCKLDFGKKCTNLLGPSSKCLESLHLPGFTIQVQNKALAPLDILKLLKGVLHCSQLKYLDLSGSGAQAQTQQGAGTTTGMDQKSFTKLIKILATSFVNLSKLVIGGWRIEFSEKAGSGKLGRVLRSGFGRLTSINCDKCVVQAPSGGRRSDSFLASLLLVNLKNVNEFSWASMDLTGDESLTYFTKCVVNLNTSVAIKLESVELDCIRRIVKQSTHLNYSFGSVIVVGRVGKS